MITLQELEKISKTVLPTTPNWKWREYLQNNLTCKGYEGRNFNIVETEHILYMIQLHATMMQEYRNWYGRSINPESGHRPELYNDVVLIENGYKSTKTSDHKCKNSCALDTDVPVTTRNINKWKEICNKHGVSWSIGLYDWGMHLGFRIDKPNRAWDWRSN